MNKPVAWMFEYGTDRGDAVNGISWYPNVHFKKPELGGLIRNIEPLYTHPIKEQDDYCKAYWGNNNKFVDVFLPNSETEVIRFWNNTHPVKELTDEEILEVWDEDCVVLDEDKLVIRFARAILRKAQEK